MSRDADDDVTPLGFADDPGGPPPRRPDRSSEPDDDPDDRPRRRKHRRRPTGAEGPVAETGDRILDRPDPVPAVGWWVFPTGVLAVGLLLCVVPLVVVAAKAGAGVAAQVTAVGAVAVVLQIGFVTALLTVVGQVFGIEYGPVEQAVLKLAAVVAAVDGLTVLFALCSSPCALMMAAVVGAGVFQYLFRLAIHEVLLSVAGMVFAAFLLNAVVIALVMDKVMPQ